MVHEKRKLVPILLIITMAAICVTVWTLFFRQEPVVLAPDYAPRQEEPNAQTIPGDAGETPENPEKGGSVSLTYSRDVGVDLKEQKASLLFANPGRSNQNMVLQIVIQDQVIVQSGILKPGNQVLSLELLEGAREMLSAGAYEGSFLVLYYHPETGEKAMVNTKIPVTIQVTD